MSELAARSVGWKARLATELRAGTLTGAAASLGVKLAMSATNLLMLTLLARHLGRDAFGLFAFWFNVVAFAAVAAGLGQEKLILRNWSEHAGQGAWGTAHGAVRFGAVATLAGTVALGLFLMLAAGRDGGLAFGAALAAFGVLTTLFNYVGHLNRAVVGIVGGSIHEVTWRAIVIAAVLIAWAAGTGLEASEVFAAAALGMAVALAAQVATAARNVPSALWAAPPLAETRLWWPRALRMAFGGNLEAAAQYLDVIVIGLVLSPAAAGGYFVAARLAGMFLMISTGMDGFTTRQIPRLHFGKGRAELAGTLRRVALLTALPVAAGLVGILLFGRPILGLFGPDFGSAYPILAALAVGTALQAMAGPAMPLLVLTGHEGAYSAVLAGALVLRLAAFVTAALFAGPVAAAAASAVATAAGAAALVWLCRRRLGLDPSVLGLVSRAGAAR